MPALHRLQWIDTQIRAGRYPNTRSLAERFEISRCQAQRDFDYLRDSLGAPLVYSAPHRGFHYADGAFVLPGPYVTDTQRSGLSRLADYYTLAARQDASSSFFAEMAALFTRLSETGNPAAKPAPAADGSLPYRALLRPVHGPRRPGPSSLLPYQRGEDSQGRIVCEFHDPATFLAALLAADQPCRIDWPAWLRQRLLARLGAFRETNIMEAGSEAADHASCAGPPLLSCDHRPGPPGETQRGKKMMGELPAKKTVKARYRCCWTTYLGAIQGVLADAGWCDLDLPRLAGLTGLAFHLIVHESCCPSSVTVYDWLGEHWQALDRVGVLSEVRLAMPDANTYEAACRQAAIDLKAAVDRGVGAVLWGVDTAEFGVVYGYDDGDGIFLVDGVWSSGGSKPILYANLGRSCHVPILHYQIPTAPVPYDRDRAYRRSLASYLKQMERHDHENPAYGSGLAAYDNWLHALESGRYDPFGLRYLAAVYGEAKQLAATYLEHLAEEWRGLPGLPEIADRFAGIARVYRAMMPALGQDPTSGKDLQQPVPAEQAGNLAKLVREASQLEKEAVGLVRAALAGQEEAGS